MRLSDIISQIAPTDLAEIAMVIFVVVFVAISIYALARSNGSRFEEMAQLPLEEDLVSPRGGSNE